MNRWFFIFGFTFGAFILELLLSRSLGAWGNPQLLILMVVFVSLYLGIRYAIVTALLAGLCRDAIGINPFGLNLVVYMSVAYGIVMVRRFLYQPGSRFSRAVMAFFGVLIQILSTMILLSFDIMVDIVDMFYAVFFPSIITTIVVATPVFTVLKNVAQFMRIK